jgi:thiol:disulfide interchange protein DsbC
MPSPRALFRHTTILGFVLAHGAALAEPDATPAPVPDSPAAVKELVGRIDGLHRLPLAGVQLVRVGDRLLFVADNGRYVFSGPAFDLWHGARLETFDQAVNLAQRIDLARLKLDPAALGALDLGTGPRDVVAFVDPLCPHCRSLLDALPPLADRYRFRLVPLPVLGKGSQDAVLRLNCLAERDPAAARQALLEYRTDQLPKAEGACGQAAAQRALVAAQLLGVTAVPLLIAPDGRVAPGVPRDLARWLEGAP